MASNRIFNTSLTSSVGVEPRGIRARGRVVELGAPQARGSSRLYMIKVERVMNDRRVFRHRIKTPRELWVRCVLVHLRKREMLQGLSLIVRDVEDLTLHLVRAVKEVVGEIEYGRVLEETITRDKIRSIAEIVVSRVLRELELEAQVPEVDCSYDGLSYFEKVLFHEGAIRKMLCDNGVKGMEFVPLREMWRFVMDGVVARLGAYAFEINEAGYVLGCLRGLAFMLERLDERFSADLYEQLHIVCVSGIAVHREKGLEGIEAEFRTNKTCFEIDGLEFWKEILTVPEGCDNIFEVLEAEGWGKIHKGDKNGFEHFAQDREVLRAKCQEIFDRYYDKIAELNVRIEEMNPRIKAAESKEVAEELEFEAYVLWERKLDVILRTCQELNIRHFFGDGNGRSATIVLQRMLLSNLFGLTIVNEPSKLACASIDPMRREVKDGFEVYRNLAMTHALMQESARGKGLDPLERALGESEFAAADPYWRANIRGGSELSPFAVNSEEASLPYNPPRSVVADREYGEKAEGHGRFY